MASAKRALGVLTMTDEKQTTEKQLPQPSESAKQASEANSPVARKERHKNRQNQTPTSGHGSKPNGHAKIKANNPKLQSAN